MNVVGIDLSTRAVDYVLLPFDSDRAEWVRVDPQGRLAEDRLADMRGRALRGSFWDDVALVAIEWPSGQHRRGDKVLAFLGLVVAHIPTRLVPWYFRPTEWRKAAGVPGNASKSDVQYAMALYLLPAGVNASLWPQDAFDAFGVAYAARAINQHASEAAA